MFRIDDVLHVMIVRPWFIAKNFIGWNEQKYGADTKGTSIDASILKDDTIKHIVFRFPETNIHVKTTVEKIKKYLFDTPQALKTDKHEIVIPLSICEDVPEGTEYDVDINQFQ